MKLYDARFFAVNGVVGTYALGSADIPRTELADDFCVHVGAAWDVAKHLSGAGSLIVRQGDRTAVAVASKVMIGDAKLNVGFLLTTLRELYVEPEGEVSSIKPFAGRFQHALWGIAERLARAHSARVMTFRLGADKVTLHADADGIRFLKGCRSVDEFVATVRKAALAGESMAYSLTADPKPTNGRSHSVMSLLATETVMGDKAHLAPDGWPSQLMAGATFGQAAELVRLAQGLADLRKSGEVAFDILDRGARVLLSGRTLNSGVEITASSAYLAHA